MLLSCRQGSLAWQPGLDQLPKHFIRHFPKTSLIVAYPSESRNTYGRYSGDNTELISSSIMELMSPDRIVFGLEYENPEKAVFKILMNFLKSRSSDPESTASMLAEELLPSTLEIIEGTVLLHVHCENTDEPTILLGISNSGISFTGVDNSAKSIFILLSPSSDNPEKHLQILSDIARFALSMKNNDILHKAKSLPDLQSLLQAFKMNIS
jgi:mannitol/fructose-specific phosphotransferase system IIA component (Ntr-type)